MKKIVSVIVLSFVLTLSVFADGDFPIGGRSCPNQSSCFTAPTNPSAAKTETENPIVKQFSEFFKFIFG